MLLGPIPSIPFSSSHIFIHFFLPALRKMMRCLISRARSHTVLLFHSFLRASLLCKPSLLVAVFCCCCCSLLLSLLLGLAGKGNNPTHLPICPITWTLYHFHSSARSIPMICFCASQVATPPPFEFANDRDVSNAKYRFCHTHTHNRVVGLNRSPSYRLPSYTFCVCVYVYIKGSKEETRIR